VLAALAYAAVAQAAPDAPAGGEVDAAVANGQPKGPAVLTSPPSHGGKVVDVAPHGVLLERCLIYRQLWMQQNRHLNKGEAKPASALSKAAQIV